MVFPRRWNPVGVEIAPINANLCTPAPPSLSNDPRNVWRSPVNRKQYGSAPDGSSTKIIYEAQVNFGDSQFRQDRRVRTEPGEREDTFGWLVMRLADLQPKNPSGPVKPEKGWKITRLYVGAPHEIAVDYKIEEVRYESPLRRGPLLLYVEFERDRER